ncbi:DMT family transporter [Roseateles amylovorans]|uniref:DMT family transporter n=1 Tax=Roseateles amylovorans TaxID=2978473 RepID=A0ABY6B0P5_9BURK|nr:DMT family transporter [Roseateles amylovorans]UXH78743.1 DMT family transporter [Roseateles amylovorans]
MLSGLMFALAAGLMWGLVFVAPLLLPDYPAVLLTAGRYLAFGLIALPLALIDRRELARLTREDWWTACRLSAIGNFLYYLTLSAAIQRAGGPLPTMIIGTLPVVIAVCANQRNAARDGHFRWRQLAPPLLLIAAGIGCVNRVEQTGLGEGELGRYLQGAGLALIALACWTWYPIRNADWLRAHADRPPRAWATAQGLVTLPMAVLAYALMAAAQGLGLSALPPGFDFPLGSRPWAFVGLMLAVGLFASWLGTMCWNEASQRLPTTLAGQLIVFETLSALVYGQWHRGGWPAPLTVIGAGLLIAGVSWALRLKPVPPTNVGAVQVNAGQ